jgi:hypothetical protein
MSALNTITWNRLRIAGLIGGVLVLLLLAVVVLVNVFTPADDGQASLDEVGVVDGERVADLDELGMLTPPVTEDPTVFGPMAIAALYTYDTRVADYQEATAGIKAWLQDFDAEPFLQGPLAYGDAEETIRRSPFPNAEAYRDQSEREVSVTAVVGDVKIDEQHRDWSPDWEFSLLHIVTADLEVTYEFTNDDGSRRELVENLTVSVELRCGQSEAIPRPTANCVVSKYPEEFWI